MKQAKTARIRILASLFFIFSTILVSRLYYLQIMKGANYDEIAQRQYMKPYDQIFDRGTIYFQNKDGTPFVAAGIKTGYILAINPTKIVDAEATYEKISKFIKIDKEEFLAKAGRTNDPYEEVADRVNESAKTGVEKFALSGVNFYKDKWRYYPGEKLASQTLGFVAYKGDSLVGRYGLEQQYDATLQKNQGSLYSNFFSEIFSEVNKGVENPTDLEGDVYSTIEPYVQKSLEATLKSVEAKWQSDLTGGIVMDPNTGEILAMASLPDFNPNTFNEERNLRVFSNPNVDSIFEMGSIIKPLTMSAGIDAGAVRPTTTYEDKGFVESDGLKIWNHDLKAHGVTSMQEVLNQSLNTGVSFVVSKMGREKFAQYMTAFGLGEKTGITLPGEVKGKLKNLSSTRNIEYFTASFGQGIAMTPIETARALSSLANGGLLVTPKIVSKIKHNVGYEEKIFTAEPTRVLKPETSKTITKMLTTVVDKALLGGAVKMERYSIAAKTGTAQISNPETGKYYNDRYFHSFFGYFPASNPKFLIFLYTKYPKGAEFASHTLTTPFMNLTKDLIHYYRIQPDR